ncbi:DUF6916 family protein [Caenimonas aquaedulcis]|uniref:DUF6916 domain-containing protein n=1 Tax=Caenimonas aquaedulcis TaxID=2793270 RepID=A0A931MGY5_9BURK|nr:hypothetical protein [Caenimonas aquaedulcis]MBG9388413.1 hypothetical protein [Caenimonas aquaedulcis]
MIQELTRRDFTGLEPASIAVDHQGNRLALSVVETRDLPPISPRAHPFAVILSGPPAPVLAQGVHALLHPQRGRLELFMVPVGRDAHAASYEIVFN